MVPVIKNVAIIATSETIGARRSAPVAKNGNNSGGTTHVTACDTGQLTRQMLLSNR